MPNLELTSPEQQLLLEILQRDLKSLKAEISKTELKEFRHALFLREKTLESIVRALLVQSSQEQSTHQV